MHPAIMLARPRAVVLLDSEWSLAVLADFARSRPRASLLTRAARVVGLSGDEPEVSRRMAAPQVDWAADAEPTDAGYTLAGPLAVIDVKGVMTQDGYYDWWEDRWVGGYAQISAAIRAAEADERVKAKLIRFDTPGGLVDGCFECAADIRAASARNGGKPTWGSVMMACSAGYALASACDRILAPASVYVGSIGVYMVHVDISKMLAEMGLKVTEIVSDGATQKTDFQSWKPLSEEALADGQAVVDETSRLFFACVNAGRPDLAAEFLKGLKGRAFMAQHSDASRSGLALKLIDAVASERDTAADLAQQFIELPDPAPPADDQEETAMDDGKLAAILASNDSADEKAKKIKALSAEGKTGATATAGTTVADATKAANDRAQKILGSDAAKGREEQARYFAFETDMTAEAAIAALGKAPQAKGSRLDGRVPQPKVGASDAAAESHQQVAGSWDTAIGHVNKSNPRKAA